VIVRHSPKTDAEAAKDWDRSRRARIERLIVERDLALGAGDERARAALDEAIDAHSSLSLTDFEKALRVIDRRYAAEDLIAVGLATATSVKLGTGGVEKAKWSLHHFAKHWLKLPRKELSRLSLGAALPIWETLWKFASAERPTAVNVTGLSEEERQARRSERLDEPRACSPGAAARESFLIDGTVSDPLAYVREPTARAVRTEQSVWGTDTELGAKDLERLEVDRRAASRLARGGWRRLKRATATEGVQGDARERGIAATLGPPGRTTQGAVDQLEADADSTTPDGAILRAHVEAVAKDARELLYARLISAGDEPADAARGAGLSPGQARAFRERVQRNVKL